AASEISWSPYCRDDEESRYNHDDAHSSHLLIDGSFNQVYLRHRFCNKVLTNRPRLKDDTGSTRIEAPYMGRDVHVGMPSHFEFAGKIVDNDHIEYTHAPNPGLKGLWNFSVVSLLILLSDLL
ncbi:hypothetical protein Tco_1010951, partial [Tanacetum coccineum]